MNYCTLLKAIDSVTAHLQGRVASVVNRALVLRNWIVGAYVVEFEQKGKDRAKYGTRLLETLATDLDARGIKGLGLRSLRDCRTFYLLYPAIRQPLAAEFLPPHAHAIRQPLVAESPERTRTPISGEELPAPLDPAHLANLSWTHFLELIRIDDPWKRAFYEREIVLGNWSKRQLQRQIGSLLYERTGLSTNKRAVVRRASAQEPKDDVGGILRDPYILEFTGLAERSEYSENELCSAKDLTVVEFATAGLDQKLFVSRYLVELPSADKLRAFLEADRDQIEVHVAHAKPARKQTHSPMKPSLYHWSTE